MHVEVRIAELQQALFFDDASFWYAEEFITMCECASTRPSRRNDSHCQECFQEARKRLEGLEAKHGRLRSKKNEKLPPRLQPKLFSVELSIDSVVTVETIVHAAEPSPTTATRMEMDRKDWFNSPLRSHLYECSMREALMLALPTIALEALVKIRLYQWAPIDERLASNAQRSDSSSLATSKRSPQRDGDLCSVSEQDECELQAKRAAAKICIGIAKTSMRELLQGKHGVVISFDLSRRLRTLLDNSDPPLEAAVRTELLGGATGGVGLLTLELHGCMYDDLAKGVSLWLPFKQRSTGSRSLSRSTISPPPAATEQSNGLILSARQDRKQQLRQSSPDPSTTQSLVTHSETPSELDVPFVRLLLLPNCLFITSFLEVVKIVTWTKPSQTATLLLIFFVTYVFDIHAFTNGLLAMVGVLYLNHQSRVLSGSSMVSEMHGEGCTQGVALFPKHNRLVNSMIRAKIWVHHGYGDEAAFEFALTMQYLKSNISMVMMLVLLVIILRSALSPNQLMATALGFFFVVTPLWMMLEGKVLSLPKWKRRRDGAAGASIRKAHKVVVSLLNWELCVPLRPFTHQFVVTRTRKVLVGGGVVPKTIERLPPQPQDVEQPTALLEPTSGTRRPSGVDACVVTEGIQLPQVFHQKHQTEEEIDFSPRPQLSVGQLQMVASMDEGPLPCVPTSRYPSSSPAVQPPPPAQLSTRARRREQDTVSNASTKASSVCSIPRTPRHRFPNPTSLEKCPINGGGNNTTKVPPLNLTSPLQSLAPPPSTMHRRQNSHVTTPMIAPLSFAVVSMDLKDDDKGLGHAPVGPSSRHPAAEHMASRVTQFYNKLDALEMQQHQLLTASLEATVPLHSSASSVAGSSTLGNTRLSGGDPLGGSDFAVQALTAQLNENIFVEANSLLLVLRRACKGFSVFVSSDALSQDNHQALMTAHFEKIETFLNPVTIHEHVPFDVVTTAVCQGHCPPVTNLPQTSAIDVNCRALALLALNFLSGKKLSVFVPFRAPRIIFVVPLISHSLACDASSNSFSQFQTLHQPAHGSLSASSAASPCPPPLASALQDGWKAWSGSPNAKLNMDLILTIISSHREYWRNATAAAALNNSSGTCHTPRGTHPQPKLVRKGSMRNNAQTMLNPHSPTGLRPRKSHRASDDDDASPPNGLETAGSPKLTGPLTPRVPEGTEWSPPNVVVEMAPDPSGTKVESTALNRILTANRSRRPTGNFLQFPQQQVGSPIVPSVISVPNREGGEGSNLMPLPDDRRVSNSPVPSAPTENEFMPFPPLKRSSGLKSKVFPC